MGVTVGGGFNFSRKDTGEYSFRLLVEKINLDDESVDFLVQLGSRVIRHSVKGGNTHTVFLPKEEQIRVGIQNLEESRSGKPVANLSFYTNRRYDWKRFAQDSRYR